MSDPSALYREQLLALSKNPLHKEELEDSAELLHGRNPFCGDEIRISLERSRFDGYCCALCAASAELLCRMTEAMKDKGGTTREAIAKEVERLTALLQDPSNRQWEENPGYEPFRILLAAHQFPSRVSCILLPWETAARAAENPGI
jgi:nitrogen fixation protein NifU and related proteins